MVELLIVTAVVPIIVGALAVGLVSVFSLQASTASRLGDTSDAQMVQANFQSDVQSAMAVTTESTTTATGSSQCGSGSQVFGLEWNPTAKGGFLTYVSYIEVANGSTNGSVNLVRQFCTSGNLTTPVSTSIVAFDLPATQATPLFALTCPNDLTCNSDATTQWVPIGDVKEVVFNTTEPKSNYTYTLDAFPQTSATSTNSGAPLTAGATTSCGFASPGSGTYASTLCFVDFSPLVGSAMAAATAANSCLEMSVQLPAGYYMYFCINISGATVIPASLPTYPEAFLGNDGIVNGTSTGITPNYTNVPGDPALYQNVQGGTTTVTLTKITVVSPQGVTATGWEAMSADAETTDSNPEYMYWTSDQPLFVVNNGLGVDSASDPVGNACLADQTVSGLTGSGTTQVECAGQVTYKNAQGTQVTEPETSALKTGAAMVEAYMPSTMTVKLIGGGLEAVAFGIFLS